MVFKHRLSELAKVSGISSNLLRRFVRLCHITGTKEKFLCICAQDFMARVLIGDRKAYCACADLLATLRVWFDCRAHA